jgi:ribonucleoside-diphosphate reductase beta chain
MLLNYQRSGKMKGMCEVVEWSVRDETMHVEGMVQLFITYVKENSDLDTSKLKEMIYDLYREAVKIEDNVVDAAYAHTGSSLSLPSSDVKQYVRFLADKRLGQLGLEPIFGVASNPIEWLDWIVSGDSFKNFFEGRVTDYSASGMVGEWGW